jgi:hypothetical protein
MFNASRRFLRTCGILSRSTSSKSLTSKSLSIPREYSNKGLLSTPSSLSRSNVNTAPQVVTLGLLRENYDKWERRAPLTPSQCHDFLSQYPQSKILVQPSSHRIFSNLEYELAGAIVQEDLISAQVILGVKRPRTLENLPSRKTYMFFSHVIKGQPENMVRLCLRSRETAVIEGGYEYVESVFWYFKILTIFFLYFSSRFHRVSYKIFLT